MHDRNFTLVLENGRADAAAADDDNDDDDDELALYAASVAALRIF
jgi:hypothetical protein